MYINHEYRNEAQKKIYESIISAYESAQSPERKEEKKEESRNINIYLEKPNSGKLVNTLPNSRKSHKRDVQS